MHVTWQSPAVCVGRFCDDEICTRKCSWVALGRGDAVLSQNENYLELIFIWFINININTFKQNITQSVISTSIGVYL